IQRLKSNGTSIMLSTHRMENVEAICDNVVLLNQAKVITQGSVMDVRNSLKDNTYELKYHGTPLSNTVKGVQTIHQDFSDELNTLTFKYDGAKSDIQLFADLDIEIKEYREVIPSMQDVFLTLTESNDE
ncbi:MAG: DUF4162 domain-containing protein, partial [Bacteroidia bacterium]